MGCLNSTGQFDHWFGNIHFSGPCNRSCYFCIGQHMMALDSFNNLNTWPLPGWDDFITKCKENNVREVNLTGSNTDPLLYKHLRVITEHLRKELPGAILGLRTNGAQYETKKDFVNLFDKISLSIHSFDPAIYTQMMGSGSPPNLSEICNEYAGDIKLNIVMGPQNIETDDIFRTMYEASRLKIKRINVREPYGQPHIGDPMEKRGYVPDDTFLGMPVYVLDGTRVTYWDVHYVEVESVNLYANGRVSVTYPITKGHAETGEVKGQENFMKSGRVNEQWL